MKRMDKLMLRISQRLIYVMDEYYDHKICGQSLSKYVPSIYRDDKNGIGMTGSQSTYYMILNRIFSHVDIRDSDSVMDIGCGKGRVLAYLLSKKCTCSLNGIEINEISGKIAVDWTQRYKNANVSIGDAFELDYSPYTILFLGRPFLPVTFSEFLNQLEPQLTHPITFIYWVDQQSGRMLENRAGWTMKYRETLYKIHGLKVAQSPQRYSIWEYDPAKKERSGA